ncbi:MAG: MerR family transcriptional regulator [Alphaproteobacteria bacterium]
MANEPFISINEVAKQLDIPAHTLRYWEKQFPVSIKPATGAGGRRYYRPETVAALKQVRELLYDRGMTIAGVKKLIKDGKFMNADITVPNEKPIGTAKPAKQTPGTITDSISIDKAIDLLEQARKVLKP